MGPALSGGLVFIFLGFTYVSMTFDQSGTNFFNTFIIEAAAKEATTLKTRAIGLSPTETYEVYLGGFENSKMYDMTLMGSPTESSEGTMWKEQLVGISPPLERDLPLGAVVQSEKAVEFSRVTTLKTFSFCPFCLLFQGAFRIEIPYPDTAIYSKFLIKAIAWDYPFFRAGALEHVRYFMWVFSAVVVFVMGKFIVDVVRAIRG